LSSKLGSIVTPGNIPKELYSLLDFVKFAPCREICNPEIAPSLYPANEITVLIDVLAPSFLSFDELWFSFATISRYSASSSFSST